MCALSENCLVLWIAVYLSSRHAFIFLMNLFLQRLELPRGCRTVALVLNLTFNVARNAEVVTYSFSVTATAFSFLGCR